MRFEYGDVPDDERLDIASRVAIEELLHSGDPAVRLDAVRVARQDFLKKPDSPRVLAFFQSDPRAMEAMCQGALSGAFPPAVPLMSPAEDCVTVEVSK